MPPAKLLKSLSSDSQELIAEALPQLASQYQSHDASRYQAQEYLWALEVMTQIPPPSNPQKAIAFQNEAVQLAERSNYYGTRFDYDVMRAASTDELSQAQYDFSEKLRAVIPRLNARIDASFNDMRHRCQAALRELDSERHAIIADLLKGQPLAGLKPQQFVELYTDHIRSKDRLKRLPPEPPHELAEAYLQLHPQAEKADVIRQMKQHWQHTPEPAPKAHGPMPGALSELQFVKELSGSTGPVLMRNAAGEHFVVKRGANPEQAQEEYEANRVYAVLGAHVPDAVLLKDEKGKAFVSRFMEGQTWREYFSEGDDHYRSMGVFNPVSGPEKYYMMHKIGDHFVVDALLGNYDVMANGQNVLVTPDKKLPRIDVGGSFTQRAAGKEKKPWDIANADMDTLRSTEYPHSKEVYGRIDNLRIAKQILDVRENIDKVRDVLSSHKFQIFEGRLQQLEQRYEQSIRDYRKSGLPAEKKLRYVREDVKTQHGV